MKNWEKHLKQVREENKKQLNRMARLAMLKEQHCPNDMNLHCLEAAQWGIFNGPNNPSDAELEDKIETLMYYWEPQAAMNFIEKRCLVHDLPQRVRLVDIATFVLKNLTKDQLQHQKED